LRQEIASYQLLERIAHTRWRWRRSWTPIGDKFAELSLKEEGVTVEA